MSTINFPDIDEEITEFEKMKRLLDAARSVLRATRREHKQLCELLDDNNIDYSHIIKRINIPEYDVTCDSSGQYTIE